MLRFARCGSLTCASNSLGIEVIERSRTALLNRIVEEWRLDGHCSTLNCLLLGHRELRNVVSNRVWG